MRFSLDLISKYRAQLYGIAILWVVFYHGVLSKWLVIPPSFGWLDQTFRIGDIGVDIFLLLSGMSLYFAMAKRPTLGHFMYRRLIRLYLPYLVICVWFFAYDYLIAKQSPLVFGVNLTMLGLWVFGQLRVRGTWYVGGILVCYLMYPYLHTFIFGGRHKYSDIVRCAILMMVGYLIAWAMHKYNADYYKLVDVMMIRFPVFFFGCLLGKRVYERRTLNFAIGWTVITVLFVAFYVLRILPGFAKGTWWFRAPYLFGSVSICYLLCGVMQLVDRCSQRVGAALGKPLIYCGGISLELYLSSQMLRWSIGANQNGQSVWIWVAAMVIAFIFAAAASTVCDRIRHFLERTCGLGTEPPVGSLPVAK